MPTVYREAVHEREAAVDQDVELAVRDDELMSDPGASQKETAAFAGAARAIATGYADPTIDVRGGEHGHASLSSPAARGFARRSVMEADGDIESPRRSLPKDPDGVIAGKYKVERVLGKSRTAVTLQVRHVELGQRYLLVHLHPSVSLQFDAVARFLKGARAALQLQSKHAARTIDAGRLESGIPYVVTEFPAGASLRSVLEVAGVLSINAAVDYTLQAIEALAEAHTNELVHGNLTPSHLFVTRGPDGLPVVKVLGFGVADSLCSSPLGDDRAVPANESTLGDFPEGTTTMAPEQIRGSMDIDALVDVWGLGGLLHHLLTGQPVFQATTGPALVAMIAADSPAPVTALRTDVPAGLESIVLRCLAKDRRERFATVGELAVALEAYASPDLQTSVNRIVRTLVKSTRPPPLPHGMGSTQAMVHVPRPPSNPPPTAPAPVPSGTPVPGSVSGMSLSSLQEYAGDGKGIVIPKSVLVGLASFVALGLAAVLGGAFASRLASPASAPSASVAAAAAAPKAAPPAEAPAAPAEPQAPAASASAPVPATSAATPPAATPPAAVAAPAQPAPVAPAAQPAPVRPAPAPVARAPVARAAPAKAEKQSAPERRASAPAAPAAEKRASADDLFDDTR